MQINYQKTVNNYVIRIDLETASFTADEDLAMQELGEPLIVFDKTYTAREFPVVFDRSLKTGFKITVKFNGQDGALEDAITAANTFMTELQAEVTAKMLTLMTDFKALKANFKVGSGTINIKY